MAVNLRSVIYLRTVASPGTHREQIGPMAESPNRPTSGARYVFRCASSKSESLLRYFLLASGKTVTTLDSGPSCSCTCNAARKLQPEEIPTPKPRPEASFCA